MRDDVNQAVYASWTDRVFNPWISSTRCLGSAFGIVASLGNTMGIGSGEAALSWERNATTFQSVHGRRQRVFAGPWCWALDPNASERDRGDFETLLASTPSLDWCVLGTPTQLVHAATQGFLSRNPSLWVGIKFEDPDRFGAGLAILNETPASLRYAVISSITTDYGELDFLGLDWLIISIDADQVNPDPNWIASVKLQAMGYGVPVWFDTPSAYLLGESVCTPFTVREHPGRQQRRA